MIEITEGNVYAFVKCDTQEEHQFVVDALTFTKEAKAYARFKIRQRTRLFSRMGENIFIFKGLTYYIISKLYEVGHQVIVHEGGNKIESPSEVNKQEAIKELRDYQIEAFDKAIEKSGGILSMATNAGKTQVAGALIKAYPEKKFLYLVHRLELLEQVKDRLSEFFDLDVGEISTERVDDKQVVVAMIQTLNSRLEQLQYYLMEIDGLIVDECQHFGGGMAKAIMSKCTSVQFRLGMTGTIPDDECAKLSIVQYLGDVVYKQSNKELIDEGYSSNIKITIYKGNWNNTGVGQEVRKMVMLEQVGMSTNLWHEVHKIAVVQNVERNRAIAKVVERLYQENATGILIFVDYIEHGVVLSELTGLPLVFSGSEDRTDLFQQFKAGYIRGLISSPILDEGIDVSRIHFIILASGKKSKTKLLQRIGRGLRVEAGKDCVQLIDFYDGETPMLKKHTERRIEIYKAEGFEVEMKNLL